MSELAAAAREAVNGSNVPFQFDTFTLPLSRDESELACAHAAMTFESLAFVPVKLKSGGTLQ